MPATCIGVLRSIKARIAGNVGAGRCRASNGGCSDQSVPACCNRKHQPWRDAGRTQKRHGPVAVQWADATAERPPADTAGHRGWSFESKLTGSPRFFPLWLLGFFRCAAPSWRTTCCLVRCSRTACLDTTAQSIHQIDDVCGLAPLWPLDRLAFLLLFKQVFQGILIAIIELARVEVSRLRLHDMRGEIEHIFRNLFVGNPIEIVRFVAHLVWVSECDSEEPLAARFQCILGNELIYVDRALALDCDGF